MPVRSLIARQVSRTRRKRDLSACDDLPKTIESMLKLLKYFLPFTRYPYAGDTIGCPVCSCDSSLKVAGMDRRLKLLPTFACDHCGLLYTNPMPTENELYEYYTRLYRLDYQGAANQPTAKHVRKRTLEAQSRFKHLVDRLKRPSRTLDFGCGTGEFVTCLRSEGHDAHGFEPGQNYGSYAQTLHGDRIKIQAWQHVSYDEPFDLVSCFHVLEHLRDPVAALKKIAEWTRPDGLVYIEVPDMGTQNRNKGFGAMHFAHVIGFNHHNLLVAASLAGLTPALVVSSTGIIFSRDSLSSQQTIELEAMKGKQLTLSLYANGRSVSRYLRYQAERFFDFLEVLCVDPMAMQSAQVHGQPLI